MAKQDIKIYKVKSKEDYIRQREKDTGLKNIFLTEMKPDMSRDDRLEILIKAIGMWVSIKKVSPSCCSKLLINLLTSLVDKVSPLYLAIFSMEKKFPTIPKSNWKP